MYFINSFDSLRLDLVGIVAILGEASTNRVAQISASTWWHVLPRLMPAPQALLGHERERRLPTERGMVVTAYSGNLEHEVNFFCRILHPEELGKHQVEFLTVTRKVDSGDQVPYAVRTFTAVAALSMFGFATAVILIALSIHYKDGFALIGTVTLAITSSLVGYASRWRLTYNRPDHSNTKNVPDSDVVIYYPDRGAFRVIRCDEATSRLYFTPERTESLVGERGYRYLALSGTVALIAGLVCLGNAQPILQLAFAAVYILLNVAYWVACAQSMESHWKHHYDIGKQLIELPNDGTNVSSADSLAQAKSTAEKEHTEVRTWRAITARNSMSDAAGSPGSTEATASISLVGGTFTRALWSAIALTGSSDWLVRSRIAPRNAAWDEWLRAAGEAATGAASNVGAHERVNAAGETVLVLPEWPYRYELSKLFAHMKISNKRRPAWSSTQIQRRHASLAQLDCESSPRV